ncbi:amidohydrolase family protein [Pseudoalteromonas sp. MMG005]|nr:amidohydrolase family protein [Pseudoalteromonas sp. MMG005]
MIKRTTIFMIFSCVLGPFAHAEPILLTNGTLLEPSTQSVIKQHLLLDGDRIISRLERISNNFMGKQIDIAGKYVIPGLIDMHTHAFGNRAPNTKTETMGPSTTAQVVLHAGVTGFVDLFGNEQRLFEHRRLQHAKLITGADIYASLSCLTAPGGHCSQFGKTRTISNEQEATRHIAELAKKQADVIKLVSTLEGKLPSLTAHQLEYTIKEAKKYGIKTIVHIHTLADIENAIKAKADAITHLPDDTVLPIELAKTLAENGIAVIPTTSVDTDYYEFLFSNVLEAPLAKKVAASRILDAYAVSASNMTMKSKHKIKRRTNMYYQSLANLIAADVKLLAGSDSGNYGTLQGFTMHRELEKFVSAGQSPWLALASATSYAREFLNRPTGLNKNGEASLVILNSSPIEDIKNSQDIFAVIHRGKLIN